MILVKMIPVFAKEISRGFLCPIHKASGVCHRTGGYSSFNKRKSVKSEQRPPVYGRRPSAVNEFSAKTGFYCNL